MSRSTRVWRIALMGVPLLVALLWVSSGREVLTKSRKAVPVTVEDELFGGTVTQTQMVAGPVLGYYVGLDLVAGAAGLSLLGAVILRVRALRRRRRGRTNGRSTDEPQSENRGSP